ncbi:myelin expression factor 2 [Trichonephila inaurata madagascariensis]|uniref:Myelin expression factor 2 n=1 Tax=Trichonephila inaurata madagascariensis TaxID=2747483 RepID=A0A8X6X940_9ARAC|nr:myelin expression factor 2 [Trichonephila inaurata madagascariensis]
MSAEGRFERERYGSRSRSRSPFRKNFNERSYADDDYGKNKNRRRERSPDIRRSGGGGMGGAKNRVFVNNIPFECRWMELKDLFREKVGDVAFVELFEDEHGKFKGCGIVEFKDNETALKAVEIMHKYELRGRPLNVKLDSGEMDRRRVPSRTSDRDFMRNNEGFGNNEFRHEPPYNTYGLNPDFLKSLGIHGPLNNKVFISNLDYKVTEKKLEEIFKIAGKLAKVELNVDNEGKSKGHGTAEYEHPLEAVQAISMFNGQRLFARIINVRMDKFSEEGDSIPAKLPAGLHGIGKGLGMNGQPMQFSKNATGPNGSFGFGMGMGGSVGGGVMSGVGSSNLLLSSSGMGLAATGSMGMNNSMAADRMMGASAMGMGMSGSSMGVPSPNVGMGMGGSSSMMPSGNVMGRSGIDNMGRDPPYQLGSGGRSYRDGFDRSNDSYNNSSLSDTVLLGNLPSSFSWQTLKDRFRDIGEVRFAELKGQGNALIRFGSVQDAQRAVDLMNGYRMDGRAIQVRFY